MREFLTKVTILVNEATYLKDPESSQLGRRIITGSIDLMDELGFECFTFRKLAEKIGSTEASIYRYFENKHKLLLYLTCWYWGWMEYRLVFGLANIPSPHEKLERAIRLITEAIEEDSDYNHINEVKLNRIIIAESSKVYLTREVDEENKHGVFAGYKQIVKRISEVILEINPEYPYPRILVSSIIEGAHHERFFTEHLPRLTDINPHEDTVTNFYIELAQKAIQ